MDDLQETRHRLRWLCVSASGNVIPPMVIFKKERLNHELSKGEVLGTLCGLSENA